MTLRDLREQTARECVALARKLGELQNALFDQAFGTQWHHGKLHGAAGILGNALSAFAVMAGVRADEAYGAAVPDASDLPTRPLREPVGRFEIHGRRLLGGDAATTSQLLFSIQAQADQVFELSLRDEMPVALDCLRFVPNTAASYCATAQEPAGATISAVDLDSARREIVPGARQGGDDTASPAGPPPWDLDRVVTAARLAMDLDRPNRWTARERVARALGCLAGFLPRETDAGDHYDNARRKQDVLSALIAQDTMPKELVPLLNSALEQARYVGD